MLIINIINIKYVYFDLFNLNKHKFIFLQKYCYKCCNFSSFNCTDGKKKELEL